VAEYAPYSIPSNRELQMIFHFHQYGSGSWATNEADQIGSQSFDRIGGGLQRNYDPKWKLSALKKVFNTWQVEMEQAGGWNSN